MVLIKQSEKRYHGYLPHLRTAGRTYHVRFSIACPDRFLDEEWKLALVEEALLFRHKVECLDFGYVVMPDHVHAVIKPLPLNARDLLETDLSNYHKLEDTLGAIKKHTSLVINRRCGRSGPFWQAESFDRIIRGEQDLDETVDYIHHNPVRRGLVERPDDYRWSSLNTIYSGKSAYAGWFEL